MNKLCSCTDLLTIKEMSTQENKHSFFFSLTNYTYYPQPTLVNISYMNHNTIKPMN